MADIETLLSSYKDELDKLEVPEDMENKLRNSLDRIPGRRRIKNLKRVAVFIVALFFIGYNLDALAYYGRKFIGYDNIMNGTLKKLDELGEGQGIGKTYEFKNGVSITLDGIMLDDNNLVAFYTVYDPDGNVEDVFRNLRVELEGAFNYNYGYSGQGEFNEEGTEMLWIATFDKPKFYEKNMKLKFELTGDIRETGVIEFKLNRNKAMGHTLNIPINTEVEIGQRRIEIKELLASPISTVIKGQIQNIMELGIDHVKGERFMAENIEIALLADGNEVQVLGSGITTDMRGINFEIRYDALPKDTKRIDIKLISLSAFEDIKETFELNKGKGNDNISILDTEIIINDIYESEGNTYMKVTTYEDLILSQIRLVMDGVEVEPERTISGQYEKEEEVEIDSLNSIRPRTKFRNTRIIEFKGTGENLELKINRVKLNRNYHEVIYTYEEK